MPKNSPNLQKCIKFFNSISFWVATEIVNSYQLSASTQIEVVRKFIMIAHHMAELRNYDLLMAITSALNSSSISRLKTMWRQIPSDSLAILKKLEEMMQPTHNYRVYRNLLNSRPKDAATIPYIGLLLRDITFCKDGNKDFLDNGTVNEGKIAMIGSYLQEFYVCTSPAYPPMDCKAAYHVEINYLDEERIYECSLLCEPRRSS